MIELEARLDELMADPDFEPLSSADPEADSTAAAPPPGRQPLPQITAEDMAAREAAAASAATAGTESMSLDMLEALQTGLTRAQKRDIQQGLRNAGHYSGFIDGVFGIQTRRAIEGWQAAIGAPVTGLLTPGQISRLTGQ